MLTLPKIPEITSHVLVATQVACCIMPVSAKSRKTTLSAARMYFENI